MSTSNDSKANEFLREMLRLRTLEHELTRLSRSGDLRGSLHLCEGQEAIPAGVCAALKFTDWIGVTYRGHGYILAKGADLDRVVAEILGRQTGTSKGKGGKMHVTDLSVGVLGANGIVGAGVPHAAGAAWQEKLSGKDGVAVAVIGDGALNQGVVHETLNMVGLYKLPFILIIENNLYAEMTPIERSSAVTDFQIRLAAYDIPTETVDGNDVFAVYEAMERAVSRAREGKGASCIEALTYRVVGHYQADPGTAYRTAEEVERWREKDPIVRLRKILLDAGVSPEELELIRQKAISEVKVAVDFALASPLPGETEATEDVFAGVTLGGRA